MARTVNVTFLTLFGNLDSVILTSLIWIVTLQMKSNHLLSSKNTASPKDTKWGLEFRTYLNTEHFKI